MSGIIGGIVATLLLGWLASLAKKDAKSCSGRLVLEYGRAVRVTGWFFALLGLFFIYAAAHASEDQTVIAMCVGGSLSAGCMALFLEFHFVRIEFDAESIYLSSPWRRRRVIRWADIVGYSYSNMNRWHILKTCGRRLFAQRTLKVFVF